MESKNTNNRGIGFFGVLQVAFIVMKVAGNEKNMSRSCSRL